MEKIKINVEIDVNDAGQVLALNVFLTSIGKSSTLEVATPVKEEPVAEEPVKKAPVKRIKKVAEVKADPEPTEPKDEVIKIEEVRAMLAKKVGDHRAPIKAKLTEMGANNVTSLEETSYPEFMGFLTGLE
jgi:hypothetical protein